MKCPDCQGTGKVGITNGTITHEMTCFECGGTGIIHCCEGLQEQPAEKKDETVAKTKRASKSIR